MFPMSGLQPRARGCPTECPRRPQSFCNVDLVVVKTVPPTLSLTHSDGTEVWLTPPPLDVIASLPEFLLPGNALQCRLPVSTVYSQYSLPCAAFNMRGATDLTCVCALDSRRLFIAVPM